jgi:N-acyl-D-aspartate/D-glutamate deacylase
VKDGRIAAVGAIEEPARRRIDADGRIVAPGFIDVHTHYDAQWAWDAYLSPSPFHGVTTALAGNCGFTLAPMEENAIGYLTEMLARVEGMPLGSLRNGLDICWRTFAEFLAAVEGQVAINVGFMVGHSTVRRVVMGDDWRRTATEDELESMRHLVAASLDAGALGLSSSWCETHNDAMGDPVPSRFADETELVRLSAEVGCHPGTWLEFLAWATGPFPEDRAHLMANMSAAAKRPLNWNLLTVRPDVSDEVIENRLAASDLARQRGGSVFGLTLPIPQTFYLNLDSGFLFDSTPAWADVLARPKAKKKRLLSDPNIRRRLVDVAREANRMWYDVDRLHFEEVMTSQFADVQGRTVVAAAERRQADPWDLLFDVALADDLRTVLTLPAQGDDRASWDRRARVWRDERVLIGGSDAGAHLDMVPTFGYCTDFVGPTVRERQLLSLEEAVRKITDDAAQAFGLTGRGRLAVGYAADVVVFDEASIATGPVRTLTDLPDQGTRLYADATGIDIVVVNGTTVVEGGDRTEDRSGTVLRSGRDTQTVSLLPR